MVLNGQKCNLNGDECVILRMNSSNMPLIRKYFPHWSERQYTQIQLAQEAWKEWNEKINVISRKDSDALEERHILHSLAPVLAFDFKPGTRFTDVGTGGGFPGIPMAIALPECHFVLLDSVAKKIRVAEEVIQAAGIENVHTFTGRSESYAQKAEFVISRAVTRMKPFIEQTKHLVEKDRNANPQTGIIYLKGGELEGDLGEELRETGRHFIVHPIRDFFTESFFDTKFLVHIPFVR